MSSIVNMLLEAVVALLVAGAVYWALALRFKHMRYNQIPGPPRESFIYGNFSIFKRRVQEDGVAGDWFIELYHEYGDTFLIWLGPKPALVMCNPTMIKDVLTDHKSFKKPPLLFDNLASLSYIGGHRFCGDTSMLTERGGSVWEHKKRILDPAFSHQILSEHSPKFHKVAERMVEALWKKQEENGNVELRAAIRPFTADAIFSAGFSASANVMEAAEVKLFGVGVLFEELLKSSPLHTTFPRLSGLAKLAEQTGSDIADVRAMGRLMIEARTSTGEFGSVNDILDHVIAASHNKETGELDVESCLDDFLGMYAAGHTTTLATVCWTMSELIRNTAVMERLVGEVDSVWVKAGINGESDSSSIFNALKDMKYLDAVVKETLRHHPPVTLNNRVSDKAVNLGGFKIPAGTILMSSQQTMHHLPKYWEDPERFNPHRFIDSGPVPFTYFPFFMGPRRCMGKNFAILELKVLLCVTLARYNVTKDPSTPEKITSRQAVLCYSMNNLVRLTMR